MAIGMLKLRNGSKGKGVAHFNYIMREDKYKPHADKLEKFEDCGHGNMPEWAKDNPKLFWQEADKHERENGRVYKEHIIALPRELNEQQRLELVQDWIKNEIGDKHPYSFAIHTPQGMDGKDQPHVHFMFSQRTHDGIERSPDQFFKRYNSKYPERGGAKKANETLTKTQSKEKTKEQRLRLGDFINKHLERAGSRNRVDMRNWKEKGLDQKPLNITYKEMKDPLVEKAYKAKIEAQAEIKEAIKERIEMIGFGKSKAIIKDLEIRIAQEQASKAYSMPKSRQGQWVRHRQKEQGEAVTTPPPPPAQPQEAKAEPKGLDFKAIRRSQIEKQQAELRQQIDKIAQLKELATTHEKIKQQPPEIQQEIKKEALKRIADIDQKTENKQLTSSDIETYKTAKAILNSVEKVEKEQTAITVTAPPPQEQPAEQKSRKGQWVRHRQELKKEQGEAVTTPPPPPADKEAQQVTAQYIDPAFAKIKAMDKDQRQRMKENIMKALQADPKALTMEQLETVKELQTEGRKFLQALQSVETHERFSEKAEQMRQDREQGKSSDIEK